MGRQALTREEGMGSRAEVEDFMLATVEDRSESVIGLKDVRGWLGGRGGLISRSGREVGDVAVSWLCIVSILVWKNDINELHLLVVNELEMVSMGLRSLLIVENSVLGLL